MSSNDPIHVTLANSAGEDLGYWEGSEIIVNLDLAIGPPSIEFQTYRGKNRIWEIAALAQIAVANNNGALEIRLTLKPE